MKILLVGFCVYDKYFKKYTVNDAFPQVAALKLEKRLLQALRTNDADVKCVATLAVSTYPRNSNFFLPGENNQADSGELDRTLPLINLPALKLISRFMGTLYTLFSKSAVDRSVICVYSAHTPNLLAAYIASVFTSKCYFVYVPDLPIYMDMGMKRSFLLRSMKKFDARVIDYFLSKASGLIVTSKHMVMDNLKLKNIPYIVVEGISDSGSGCEDDARDCSFVFPYECSDKKIMFYAGSVNKAYGIVELVEGFKESGSSYELWLCGKGDLEEYLKLESENNKSIKYLGFLQPEQVEIIQKKSALLVLTRNPEEKYTRYSFPSKILEYLSSGVPVMTTKLDGIPTEYYSYLNFIEEYTVGGIARKIKSLDVCCDSELIVKANAAREWLLNEKTGSAIGNKIISFMDANYEKI